MVASLVRKTSAFRTSRRKLGPVNTMGKKNKSKNPVFLDGAWKGPQTSVLYGSVHSRVPSLPPFASPCSGVPLTSLHDT